ncbi:hypothetical protein V1477_013262 [Vespula maculifrons]|uniref:Uncharacterized protein n=1 Tax=Vespula maculifrons TaxID=7453 RepID=A0ABD2BVF3_VESMC
MLNYSGNANVDSLVQNINRWRNAASNERMDLFTKHKKLKIDFAKTSAVVSYTNKQTSKFYHSHRTSSVADDDNGNGGGSGGGADKKTWMDREILSFAKEATQPFIFMFALVSEVRRNGRRGPQGRNFDGGPLDFLLPSEVVRGGTRRTIAHCGRHSFADDDDVTRQVVMPRRTKKSGRESLLNPSPSGKMDGGCAWGMKPRGWLDGWAGEWLAAWPVGSSLPRTLYSHLVSSKSRGNSEQRLSLNSKTTF